MIHQWRVVILEDVLNVTEVQVIEWVVDTEMLQDLLQHLLKSLHFLSRNGCHAFLGFQL